MFKCSPTVDVAPRAVFLALGALVACDRVMPSKPTAEVALTAETAKMPYPPPVTVANGGFTARPLFSAGEIPGLEGEKPGNPNGAKATATDSAKAPAGASAKAFSWKGKHRFAWTGGKNPNGGITPSVEYEITVKDGEGGDDVTVHADGTQTMTRIIAGGVENGDTLSIGA
jgi:hypothetical protein